MMHNYFKMSSFVAILYLVLVNVISGDDVRFGDNYNVVWGGDHIELHNHGRQVQLSLDTDSGAGFGSKLKYGSGFFHMRIKLPDKNSAGVVTTFYLISDTGNQHDEVDFEFLGNDKGEPITLQTNVFTNGQGNREQRILLWFDPTVDFHNYKILWNQHQIVFYVDDTPIRVFKNNNEIGVMYPKQPMQIEASLWNATWASYKPIDWAGAPFVARYQDFNIGACPSTQGARDGSCYGSKYWWNEERYWKLRGSKKKQHDQVRKKYMNYDYCADGDRYPTPPPECASNAY